MLVGDIGTDVGPFSAAAFVDFSERKPVNSNNFYGIIGIGSYISNKHATLLKFEFN